MSAHFISGSEIADQLRVRLHRRACSFKKRHKHRLSLVALQFGEHASSRLYLRAQARAAQQVGIDFCVHTLAATTRQRKAEQIIASYNNDARVTAMIVQMPVPKHIHQSRLIDVMDPRKDAEGVHSSNLGRLVTDSWQVAPCTAQACVEILRSLPVSIAGKEVVVVGHSEIVGKPLSLLLLNQLATTTVCHIATSRRGLLREHVKRAEILIVAVGKPGLIKGEWIKKKAIVLDVGVTKVGHKIVGDVELPTAAKRASYIVPSPGGVGPVTVMMLMQNVICAGYQQCHNA